MWLSLFPSQTSGSEGGLTRPAFAPCRPGREAKCPFAELGEKVSFFSEAPDLLCLQATYPVSLIIIWSWRSGAPEGRKRSFSYCSLNP